MRPIIAVIDAIARDRKDKTHNRLECGDREKRARPTCAPRPLQQVHGAFLEVKYPERFGAKRQKKINNPPVSLPRRYASNRWVSLFVNCRVLQLLTLEAAVLKRLPKQQEIWEKDTAVER